MGRLKVQYPAVFCLVVQVLCFLCVLVRVPVEVGLPQPFQGIFPFKIGMIDGKRSRAGATSSPNRKLDSLLEFTLVCNGRTLSCCLRCKTLNV